MAGGTESAMVRGEGQDVSAAKACFDLLHLRKEPFHYKSGTCSAIWPISQEAISTKGGEREGHSKVIQPLLPIQSWEKESSSILATAASLLEIQVFPLQMSEMLQKAETILLVCRAMPLFLHLAATLTCLLASLFLEGMITNKDVFDDQIN
jgi:hypothetical protein